MRTLPLPASAALALTIGCRALVSTLPAMVTLPANLPRPASFPTSTSGEVDGAGDGGRPCIEREAQVLAVKVALYAIASRKTVEGGEVLAAVGVRGLRVVDGCWRARACLFTRSAGAGARATMFDVGLERLARGLWSATDVVELRSDRAPRDLAELAERYPL